MDETKTYSEIFTQQSFTNVSASNSTMSVVCVTGTLNSELLRITKLSRIRGKKNIHGSTYGSFICVSNLGVGIVHHVMEREEYQNACSLDFILSSG